MGDAKKVSVGDTFAVRLKSRKYGLCRVVWTKHAWKHTSVVCLDWFGDDVPTLATAKKQTPLVMQHPNYEGICWVRILRGLTAPPGYVHLGKTKPTPTERALRLGDDWHDPEQRYRSSVWKAVDHTLERERRWRVDAKYKKTIEESPRPGDVFAMLLTKSKRWMVARVLRVVGRVDEDKYATRWNIAGYEPLFDSRPTLAEAKKTLVLPSPRHRRDVVSTGDDKPKGLLLLGNLPPSKEEDKLEVNTYASWTAIRPLEELLASPRAKPQAPAKPPTLTTIALPKLFVHWKDRIGSAEVARCRKIVGDLTKRLQSAEGPTEKRTALVEAVKRFNAVDSFIETTEREELCELFGSLGASAGLAPKAVERLVDEHRDW
jgi:hypothetical protein